MSTILYKMFVYSLFILRLQMNSIIFIIYHACSISMYIIRPLAYRYLNKRTILDYLLGIFANIILHEFIMHAAYYICITTYHTTNVGGCEQLKNKSSATRIHILTTDKYNLGQIQNIKYLMDFILCSSRVYHSLRNSLCFIIYSNFRQLAYKKTINDTTTTYISQ